MKPAEKIREIETLIRQLREESDEPFSIRVGSKTSLELSPFNHDDRVVVEHKTMGSTTVNYTEEGVIVDVYDPEGLEPFQSLAIHCDDLESV